MYTTAPELLLAEGFMTTQVHHSAVQRNTLPEMPAQGGTRTSESENDMNHLAQTMTGEQSSEQKNWYADYLATLTWQNQSHAERDAHVTNKWSVRTSMAANRRLLQGAREHSEIIQRMRAPTASCDDALATNTGQRGICYYDCQVLQQHYFPSEDSHCFLYDTATGDWPGELTNDWPV
jgi:hypothetical protein